MDLAPLALCRIPDEPRAIIVNARLEHVDIIVMADRLPQVIRRLSLPSEVESLSEKLPAITEEFGRTVAFYNSSHMEKPLDSTVPVFVCGELAEAPETWQSLAGRSSYSMSPLPSPVEYPDGFSPNEFMVNIGLALKKLLPEKGEANFSIVNLNTLPQVYLPKAIPLSKILAPIGIVVGAGLLLYTGFLVQNAAAYTTALRSQLASIESSNAQTQKGIAALKHQIEQVQAQFEPVENEMEQAEASIGVFKPKLTTLEEGREEVNGDLSQIVALPPADVHVTEVNHKGDSVTVSGIAPYENDIFKYARDLRGGDRFSVITIQSIKQDIRGEGTEEIKRFKFTLLLE
jgi:Tfp pilus assembly protein PilN